MQKNILCLPVLAMAVLFGGCAYIPDATVLNTVGPVPAFPKTRSPGFLVAYTPVSLPPISSDTLFYPHSSYGLYDSRGKFLGRVRNHLGPWDESPERVALLPGRYSIRAQSDFAGDLIVPVVIRGGRTTVVDLARDNHFSVTALNPG